jgi:hypothetical protein
MINIQATIKWKGYDPSELKLQSNKRICCSCDQCGRVRWVPMYAYRNLCHKCKMKSNETRKNLSESHSGKLAPMYNKHHNEETKIKMSKSQIGKTRKTIGNKNGMFNKYHTKETRQKMSDNHTDISGINNPMWKGGISGGKYCYKFNTSLKIKIRNQYNNCDYISGIHKSICNNNRNLDVHHVNYDKQQGCDGKKWKLVPLSKVNHNRTNINREFWNKLFKYSLEYDKTYYGDVI